MSSPVSIHSNPYSSTPCLSVIKDPCDESFYYHGRDVIIKNPAYREEIVPEPENYEKAADQQFDILRKKATLYIKALSVATIAFGPKHINDHNLLLKIVEKAETGKEDFLTTFNNHVPLTLWQKVKVFATYYLFITWIVPRMVNKTMNQFLTKCREIACTPSNKGRAEIIHKILQNLLPILENLSQLQKSFVLSSGELSQVAYIKKHLNPIQNDADNTLGEREYYHKIAVALINEFLPKLNPSEIISDIVKLSFWAPKSAIGKFFKGLFYLIAFFPGLLVILFLEIFIKFSCNIFARSIATQLCENLLPSTLKTVEEQIESKNFLNIIYSSCEPTLREMLEELKKRKEKTVPLSLGKIEDIQRYYGNPEILETVKKICNLLPPILKSAQHEDLPSLLQARVSGAIPNGTLELFGSKVPSPLSLLDINGIIENTIRCQLPRKIVENLGAVDDQMMEKTLYNIFRNVNANLRPEVELGEREKQIKTRIDEIASHNNAVKMERTINEFIDFSLSELADAVLGQYIVPLPEMITPHWIRRLIIKPIKSKIADFITGKVFQAYAAHRIKRDCLKGAFNLISPIVMSTIHAALQALFQNSIPQKTKFNPIEGAALLIK